MKYLVIPLLLTSSLYGQSLGTVAGQAQLQVRYPESLYPSYSEYVKNFNLYLEQQDQFEKRYQEILTDRIKSRLDEIHARWLIDDEKRMRNESYIQKRHRRLDKLEELYELKQRENELRKKGILK